MRSAGRACVFFGCRYKMKLSVDFHGRMWTGLLLLAACCTVKAADNSSVPTVLPVAQNTTALVSTTPSSHAKNESGTTTLAPNTTHTSATTPKPVTSLPSTTSLTTSTTKGSTTTNSTITTVTSKTTSKTTTVVVTSSSPVTSTISATLQKKSGFDVGSFIGGIVLTLGLLAGVYFGCRFYNSRRGVRYRTIDEHEAII